MRLNDRQDVAGDGVAGLAGIDECGVGDAFELFIVKLVELGMVSQADFCFFRAIALEDARGAGLHWCTEVNKMDLNIGWQVEAHL